jgi:hypothetical protein
MAGTKILMLAMGLGAAVLSAGTAKDPGAAAAEQGGAGKTLDILISTELKPGNRVLILKDSGLADSLLRGGAWLRRDRFDRLVGDSSLARQIDTREEFRTYWARLSESEGFGTMKRQYEGRDIDKTRIPKAYLFDSSVVVFPGWLVVRKKASAHR